MKKNIEMIKWKLCEGYFSIIGSNLKDEITFDELIFVSKVSSKDAKKIISKNSKDYIYSYRDGSNIKYKGTPYNTAGWTTVEVVGKKTTAGIKYIQETSSNNGTDLFWASAPDAFEVLKGDSLLAKYTSKVKGIPSLVGSYPINDPDGFYTGFAAAGYGMMWNTRYLKANNLPSPKEWIDMADPIYFGHTGMSAPSRSGTTHLTVETLLQGDGFNAGWAKMKNIAANFKTVTARSFGVPDGVNSGDFGVGIVIDFFGLSSIGSGFPVGFVYPTVTTLVPANIGVITNAPNEKNAQLFIDFLLTPEGQEILLDPKIRRLPVNPKTYSKAPKDFPNPFKDSSIGAAVKFDVLLSKGRYNLVNSLFDVMITIGLFFALIVSPVS